MYTERTDRLGNGGGASAPAVDAVLAENHRDMVAHLHALARALPARPALSYLARGEDVGDTLSFGDLDCGARSLGAYFQRHRGQGQRALLLFDAGIELAVALFGCLYGRVIAAPLPAPLSARPDRYLVRIQSVIKDSGARYVLTTARIRDALQATASNLDGFGQVEWIAVDQLADRAADWVCEPIDEHDLAYLQYTSGSTSTPKGVMVSHRNVMKVVRYNGQVSGCAEFGTSTVCWMPYFHDFGLVDGLLMPLAYGMRVYLMSPFDFVQQPMRWIEAISRYRASHSSAPNFAFNLVARKSTPEQRAALDLSCWRRATVTAEPIRPDSMARFLEAFGPCGFAPATLAPSFALAESTLSVTYAEGVSVVTVDAAQLERHRVVQCPLGPGTRALVNCGRVWPGPWELEVRIVDPETCRPAAPDEVGEIWVTGDLVTQGYWQRPEQTAEKFHAEIAGQPGTAYLRTGDLGFMLGEELVFTGRRKDLMIVEGRNHYPHDIEAAAERSHPAVRPGCSIAFSLETDVQPRVVLVCELGHGYRLGDQDGTAGHTVVARQELERAIRREVSEEHQLRVHEIVVVPRGLLPKTTSGKVERSGCRAMYAEGTLSNAVSRL